MTDDRPPPKADLLDGALRLNARGFRVFPVWVSADGTGKKPLIDGHHGDHPYSPAEIRGWPWARATHLGWALGPGHIGLDPDVRDGKQGPRHLAELEQRLGPLPNTMSQRTPSGGEHRVYSVAEDHGRYPAALDRKPHEQPDIDIIHSRYRFLTVYDITMFDQDIAPLPTAWLPLLVKSSAASSSGAAPARTAPPTLSSACQVVRDAVVGSRNNTLNHETYVLACAADLSEEELDQLRAAALDAGLDMEAIEATLTSATTSGAKQRAQYDTWYAAVVHDDQIPPRSRTAARATATVFRELGIKFGDKPGLSVRDLAERTGVSHATAHRRIGLLTKTGHLKPVMVKKTPGLAGTYELVHPTTAERDTRHLSTTTGGDGGVSRSAVPVDLALYGHTALIKMRDTVTLPKSVALVLQALGDGDGVVKEIATRASLSPDMVRRSVEKLQSAGIVSYDPKGDRVIRLAVADRVAALTKWAEWAGSSDNKDKLHRRHEYQRAHPAVVRNTMRRGNWR